MDTIYIEGYGAIDICPDMRQIKMVGFLYGRLTLLILYSGNTPQIINTLYHEERNINCLDNAKYR